MNREGLAVTTAVRNVLFIMCDQLRWDYLSCYGHPTLATPHIDALARRGVRFTNAYVQASVCGPSRMSYYTGRYVVSHGAIWNFVPLRLNEWTIGDYLRPKGVRTAVVGKTHVTPDLEGLRRAGIDPDSPQGVLLRESGFEPYDRDDGVHPGDSSSNSTRYADYLRGHGYRADNPWHDFANSAEDAEGAILSGWNMRWARMPARLPEVHSETAYTTRRAMQFIDEQGSKPWCLHLSYIKPHWPYVAPAPYNDMYSAADVLPVNCHPSERTDEHPVLAGFRQATFSRNFSKPDVRAQVIPTYMGLVKQIDDRLGELFAFLERQGRWSDTLIVFASDHGDYLGDHYLGEKELFHDTVCKVPLIIYDPAAAGSRGTTNAQLVEAVDVLPTILDAYGIEAPGHKLEGRSLLPLLRRQDVKWRDYAVSESDYSFRSFVREPLQRGIDGCRSTMLRTQRWKYIRYDGMRPQLYDLANDPDELVDLALGSEHAALCKDFETMLFDWLRHRKIHTTISDADIAGWTAAERDQGIAIGEWR